jgi:hypothetical protein
LTDILLGKKFPSIYQLPLSKSSIVYYNEFRGEERQLDKGMELE